MKKYKSRLSSTAKSKFCKLSAVLYGHPKEDLSSQCKAQLSRKPPKTDALDQLEFFLNLPSEERWERKSSKRG
jgi:hypothetical protein